MKKTLAILGALMALLACNKQMAEPTVQDEGTQEVQVEFTVNRTDAFAGTKGTAKGSWNSGDVVFVFFKEIDAPKHVRLTFDGSKWTATPEGGVWDIATEFSGVSDYKMTAVFLPYGSDALVDNNGSEFRIMEIVDGAPVPYTGYFLIAQNVSYTFEGGKLKGEINLKVHEPTEGKLVHFDVIGHASGHAYEMYQVYLRPFSLIGVSMSTGLEVSVGSAGSAVPGYEDSKLEMVSFSGLLTSSENVEYTFSIKDKTSGVNYSLNAGSHDAPAVPTAISLGNLSTWMTERPYVDLGMKNEGGKSVMWATMNVGASKPEEYGDYFAWGETSPKEGSYTWDNYKYGTEDNLTKYNETDGLTTLELSDDAANANWGGNWRMPTIEEWEALHNTSNFTWTRDDDTKVWTVTSKISGYEGKSISFPSAGNDYSHPISGDYGYYWSSSIFTTQKTHARGSFLSPTEHDYNYANWRYIGWSVRPVFTAD